MKFSIGGMIIAIALLSSTIILQVHAIRDPVPLPPLMKQADFFNRNSSHKFERLNEYIMDNRGGFGGGGDFRFKEAHYFWKEPLTSGSHKALMLELSRTMVRMEKNQNFRNGNHRTAVLTVLDYLSSVGLDYAKDPMHLYLNLAQASHPDLSEKKDLPLFIIRLANQINDAVRKAPRTGISEERRNHYAERIKDAGRWHQTKRIALVEEEQAKLVLEGARTRWGSLSGQAREAEMKLKVLKKEALENEKFWEPKTGLVW